MNIDRLNAAIAIMKRVQERGDLINLDVWQRRDGGGIKTTEEEMHTCGTAGCFAGWVAVSPEFQACKGYSCSPATGAPVFDGEAVFPYIGAEAIAHWLGIDEELADALCYTGGEEIYTNTDDVAEVIANLEKLLATGAL